jgi:hypothetical protein
MSYPVCASNPPSPRRYPLARRNGVLKALSAINMVHQAHKVLPEAGDYCPGSWRYVVGRLMALIGLALLVGMTLCVSAVDTVKDVGRWRL